MSNHEREQRVLRQMQTFDEVTVECSRCGQQVALNDVRPTMLGLHCELCLVDMPTQEFNRLTA